MPENLQPESMSSWMRDVERRLSAVERPARLSTVQYTTASQPNQSVAVTSGTFTTTWEFALSAVVADAVSVASVVITDAATTGDVRVVALQLSGSPTTDAASVPAGVQKTVAFNWAPPGLTLGVQGILIQVQARRTAGAGNVNVYLPFVAMQTPSFVYDASATGNPQVL